MFQVADPLTPATLVVAECYGPGGNRTLDLLSARQTFSR